MANKNQRASYKNNKELLQTELNAAAFFKAQYEKMYYMLESEKIYEDWAKLIVEKYPSQAQALGLTSEEATSGLSTVEGTELPTGELTVSNADIKE